VAQIVETECHLALWALGEVRGLTPEAEAATVSDRAAAGVRPAASRPPRRRRTGPRPPGGS
jgi:hypothetical protein